MSPTVVQLALMASKTKLKKDERKKAASTSVTISPPSATRAQIAPA
jgi:hypothetical protein